MSSATKITSARLEDIIGAENVISEPQSLDKFRVDEIAPAAAARPANAQEVREIVKFAAAENLAIIPVGARTKLGMGMPPARYNMALDVTRLDHVISYDPGDLTLSVEPGIPLARLATVLAEHNQFLPLAVPYFERATVGGTLASGVDSPLRQFYSTARDFVLGMEFVTGEGVLAKSGGRVVKNVTGYDLHKLMLGSIGSLGIITRVNFKTFPLPKNRTVFLAHFANVESALEFRRRIAASPLSPLSLEILNGDASAILFGNSGIASMGISGADEWIAAVEFAGPQETLQRCSRQIPELARAASAKTASVLPMTEAAAFFERMGEGIRLLGESSDGAVVLKLSTVPSSLSDAINLLTRYAREQNIRCAMAIRGCGVIYAAFSAELQTRDNAAAFSRAIFDASSASQFTATMAICSAELKREMNFWGPPRSDFPLMQRVKQAFDPLGIFAPGRFMGGL